MKNRKTKSFSLSTYVEQALKLAEYEKDEHGHRDTGLGQTRRFLPNLS